MRLLLPLVLTLTGCAAHRQLFHVETKLDDTLRLTSLGAVVGGEGRYGSHAWLGIPFAAPPVDQLRWRAPQPVAPWKEPREALQFKPACVQFASPIGGAAQKRSDGTTGEEDCLYLNVFAPRFTATQVPRDAARLPVMVWVHGGGNSIGTAQFYEGGHLATSGNVIVVTIQYRLGPLGWFRHAALRAGSSDPMEQSGNFGTLDQIAALEWVRDNISGFGGDPSNVTLFGESAGGFDVYSLLVSPRAKGLFHRAITQSGGLSRVSNALAEHFTDDAEPGHVRSSSEIVAKLIINDGLAADRQAAKAMLGTMAPEKVAGLLRSKSVSDLFALYRDDNPARAGMLEMPLLIHDGAVLPEREWLDVLATPGGWNQVPVIAGTNRDEAKLFLSLDPAFVWRLFGVAPRMRDENTYFAVAEGMSHMWKATGADQPVLAMLRSGATEVYSYRFDWAQEPTTLGSDLSKIIGAAHGLEIPFVFGHFDLGALGNRFFVEETLADRTALSNAMMAYWAAFAHDGKPGRGRTDTLPEWLAWNASSPEAHKAMVFDVPAGGGLRSTNDVQSVEHVLDEIKSDPRFPSNEVRCEFATRLAGMRWIDAKGVTAVCNSR